LAEWVIQFNVAQYPNPTQAWLSRQLTEAFPWDIAPRYLLRDRDTSYGPAFRNRVQAMGIEAIVTAPRSGRQRRDSTTAALVIDLPDRLTDP
jgi:putative transposase